jgi:predicted DNA-binding protein
MGEGCLRIARDSKGRLSTNEITVSIKIRLEESTADQLRDMAEQLDVPMASIIRQGIIKALEELSKDVVS